MINTFSSMATWWSYVASIIERRHEELATWDEMYKVLDAYYYQNGAYEIIDALTTSSSSLELKSLRALRNPAYRVVEFYAAKIWPGSLPDALPIDTENERIVEPIHDIWAMSNWQAQKQNAVRILTRLGDLFIRVATNGQPGESGDKVFFQIIHPKYVTDFDVDERGFLTWIRLDIPQVERLANGRKDNFYHTEVWTKESLTIWKHKHGSSTSIENFSAGGDEIPLSDMGIDFIPFVYQPLKNDFERRAMGAFTLSIDKIDEVNRQVTQLHTMLFRYNKPLWVTERTDKDAQNRPLPALQAGVSSNLLRQDRGTDGLSDNDDIINLPGASTMQSLIPSIDYMSALEIINAQMAELEKDLPELAYYNLRSGIDLSGRAIRLLLGDTLDRALEARQSAESALIRADNMALTIGEAIGRWSNIGVFANGDFEHTFRIRPILETPESESAQTFQTWVQSGAPANFALRRIGSTEETIEKYESDVQEQKAGQNSDLASALLNARRNFDSGNNVNGQSATAANIRTN